MLEIGNTQNQASIALGNANTQEKLHFRMPNFVLSKCATQMNHHLERTMFTPKSYPALSVQNSFKDWSTQPDTAWYLFIEHFTLRE